MNEKEISEIVNLQLKSVEKMLESNDVKLTFKPSAMAFLSKEGYDPEFGARPVKRAIQRFVLNKLSKDLIAQTLDKSKPIYVDANKEGLIFSNKK